MTAAEQTRVEYADGRLLVKAPRRLRELSPFRDGGQRAGESGRSANERATTGSSSS
jgi:hypothetical protein